MANKHLSTQKIYDKLIEIEEKMLTKDEFEKFNTEDYQPLKSTVEELATRVKKFVDEDYPASLKRISRVDYRTEKLLGNHLETVDAEFEEKYQGEDELRKAEA